MSLLTDYALPDPDSSMVEGRHPDSFKAREKSTDRRQIRLYGRAINSGASIGDLWEAGGATGTPIVRALPATAKTIQVVSDNILDAPAQTGALTIRVNYLDFAGAEHYADYTMNGQTAVVNAAKKDGVVTGTPIADCFRVQSLFVLTAGTGAANAGNISVNDSTQTYAAGVPVTPSLIYGYMAATYNMSHHGFYTVPAGYKAQIKQKLFGVIDATTTVKYGKFYAGIEDLATQLIQTVPIAGDSSNSGGTTFPMAFETLIESMCDIRFQGIGLAASTSELIAIIDIIVFPKT